MFLFLLFPIACFSNALEESLFCDHTQDGVDWPAYFRFIRNYIKGDKHDVNFAFELTGNVSEAVDFSTDLVNVALFDPYFSITCGNGLVVACLVYLKYVDPSNPRVHMVLREAIETKYV